MSSFMPFSFNAVELCVVTINKKPWKRAREVCRAIEYGKATKATHVIKAHVSPENDAHKWQLIKVSAASNSNNWAKDSRKDDYYINKEGMYEIVFSSQQPKAKDFRRHCCNVLFPHVRQQLTSKMKEDHQQAIEEKDEAIVLLNDDLKNREHDNVALQAQRDVYKDQLQKCQDIITHLRTRHVPHAKDPDKGSIVMIIEKNTTPEEDEFCEYPYYIARIQQRFITTKRRWFKAQYPHHRPIIEELNNANIIHTFNRFEEKEYVERFQCHFRLVHIPRDVLYALATPAIQEYNFLFLMTGYKIF